MGEGNLLIPQELVFLIPPFSPLLPYAAVSSAMGNHHYLHQNSSCLHIEFTGPIFTKHALKPTYMCMFFSGWGDGSVICRVLSYRFP